LRDHALAVVGHRELDGAVEPELEPALQSLPSTFVNEDLRARRHEAERDLRQARIGDPNGGRSHAGTLPLLLARC
jgi:hypothetical protein